MKTIAIRLESIESKSGVLDSEIFESGLRALVEQGHRINLITEKFGSDLIEVLEYFRNAGIQIHSVDSPEFDILIDDRSLLGLPNSWKETFEILQRRLS